MKLWDKKNSVNDKIIEFTVGNDRLNDLYLIKVSDIIYPIEPIYIRTFLPSLSIKLIPINVKITLVRPIPTLFNNAAF